MPKLMVIRIIMSLGAVLLSRFRTLRALFITGYVLNIILWFVPSERFSFEITLSRFDYVRTSLQSDYGLVGYLYLLFDQLLIVEVLIFASNFVFLALALALPRRWVFITASSVAVWILLFATFDAYFVAYSGMYVDYILVPRVLLGVASLLTLLGFFIKPPAPRNSSLDAT